MTFRIAICAPARPIAKADAARVTALAAALQPGVALDFHPQCFAADGHFAGDDAMRLAALLDCANDPAASAVWFARGGYGACRIAEAALAGLGASGAGASARGKRFLGYSDMGYLLAGLYKAGVGQPAHGPMVADISRPGGEAAVGRALGWLIGDDSGVEATVDTPPLMGCPRVAFNLTTLAMLCGTPLMPDLTGHVVMVEEVAEHLYAIDRMFFHVTAHLHGIAGLRLGRVSEVPDNDVAFGMDATAIARHWCARRAIPFLGGADIGHDGGNRVVPFGRRLSPSGPLSGAC